MLTAEEREWISAGMAWVALQRWLCGERDGDAARRWFQDEMDRRFNSGRGVRPPGLLREMERLEAEMKRRVGLGCCKDFGSESAIMHP